MRNEYSANQALIEAAQKKREAATTHGAYNTQQAAIAAERARWAAVLAPSKPVGR